MIRAIMVDSREPEWVQKLQFGGAVKMVTTLEHGDAWITTAAGDLVCVERKTPTDLLGSIKDNRIFAQAAGMRQRTPFAYLVVTGILADSLTGMVVTDDRVTGWKWASVQGALLEVQELGVHVVTCRNDDEYEHTLCSLASRERNREKTLEPTTHSRIMSPGEVLLCSLPGIGFERAQILLREFENQPAAALAWLTWHRWPMEQPIAGISTGTKNKVREALGLADWAVIDVVRDEAI